MRVCVVVLLAEGLVQRVFWMLMARQRVQRVQRVTQVATVKGLRLE